ncbi:hypothetical protein SAV31267_092300 [Streptomyces avermitilis]|uniref:Beta-ketoacyl-[acyl-carrier-protein] synthase III N-terminal domain-containing protein n=1 Tax=Streptomyces avermitilis TaxID=33903 RepID=A0A4D4N8D5_STRAX|nr:hypothetical protein SAV31267_092300 [Streptomyces avermitilis]
MSPTAAGSYAPAAVLCGLAGWVPPRVVTNEHLARRLDTDDAWIRTRTGIRRRHAVDPGQATSDLAVEAGRRALVCAATASVDAVVVATTTPDHSCPATAPAVAARLGLTGAAAFDISAVCTGFVYGLASAAGLIAAGVAERVLLIGRTPTPRSWIPSTGPTRSSSATAREPSSCAPDTPTSPARSATSTSAATALTRT